MSRTRSSRTCAGGSRTPLIHVPREIVETLFTVERWETPERGGHFPALEQTGLLARSVREFSRSPRS